MQNLLPYGGEVFYFPQFLSPHQANLYYEVFFHKVKWQQPEIQLFGKKYLVPRLTAWYGDPYATYYYSGLKNEPLPWFEELLELKKVLQHFCNTSFNSVLINLYRHEKDSMGWHADDEKELGKNPIIASVSLGAKRKFVLRNKQNKSQRVSIELENGSLLWMKGECQHFWEHAVPKQNKPLNPRINLTFRNILMF